MLVNMFSNQHQNVMSLIFFIFISYSQFNIFYLFNHTLEAAIGKRFELNKALLESFRALIKAEPYGALDNGPNSEPVNGVISKTGR